MDFRHKSRLWGSPSNSIHEPSSILSSAVCCPLALSGSAFYPVLVHRLVVSLHAFSPHSVTLMQLSFVRCGQFTGGLASPRLRIFSNRSVVSRNFTKLPTISLLTLD